MLVRETGFEEIEAQWPRLGLLLAGGEGRKARLRELLAGECSYALVAEGPDGVPAGLAVVGYYWSAWIFDDNIAAIREWAALGAAPRQELLIAIEERARRSGMTHLSRFQPGDDELRWWYDAGFSEYMSAYRRGIDEEEATPGSDAEASMPLPHGQSGNVTIRSVDDMGADWPKLWPLLAALHAHHASLTGSPLRSDLEESDRGELAAEMERGDMLVMLGEADGQAIATSSAELGEQHADGTRTGYRSRLFIEEAYRGLGLSARFEAQALCWFREHGVSHVERWIVAGNDRPRQIWSARGYRPERVLLRKALQP